MCFAEKGFSLHKSWKKYSRFINKKVALGEQLQGDMNLHMSHVCQKLKDLHK